MWLLHSSLPRGLLDWGPRFLAGCWLEVALSSWPYGPPQQASLLQQSQQEESFLTPDALKGSHALTMPGRVSASRTEVAVLCNLIKGVTSRHLCHILFVEASPQASPHSGRVFCKGMNSRRQASLGFISENCRHVNYLGAKPSLISPNDKPEKKYSWWKSMHTLGRFWCLLPNCFAEGARACIPSSNCSPRKPEQFSPFKILISPIGENGTTLNLLPLTFMVSNLPVFLPTDPLLSVSFLYSSFYSPHPHKMCPKPLLSALFFFPQSLSKFWEAHNGLSP